MAETMYKLGPVGNVYRQTIWDEKGRSEVVQIFFSFANHFVNQTFQNLSTPGSIKSIGFQYLEDGKVVLSQVFGDPKFPGPKFSTAKLDYPSEYITGLSGYWFSDSIEELTIHTNKKSHGPFGRGGVELTASLVLKLEQIINLVDFMEPIMVALSPPSVSI